MKYLKLFLNQSEIFESLPDEEAGQLIKAVFAYMNGDKIELEGMLNTVFVSIRQGLDRSIEEYEETVLRNRENGKKGGRPVKPTGLLEKPKKPTGLSGLLKKPTKTQEEEEEEEENIKEKHNSLKSNEHITQPVQSEKDKVAPVEYADDIFSDPKWIERPKQ